MAPLLRAPGGTGNADVSGDMVKVYLDAGWSRIDEEGKSARAPRKTVASADTAAAATPSSKPEWLALAAELGIEVDPKATKPVIVAAVKAHQESISSASTKPDESDDDESDDDESDDDESDDGSSAAIND